MNIGFKHFEEGNFKCKTNMTSDRTLNHDLIMFDFTNPQAIKRFYFNM